MHEGPCRRLKQRVEMLVAEGNVNWTLVLSLPFLLHETAQRVYSVLSKEVCGLTRQSCHNVRTKHPTSKDVSLTFILTCPSLGCGSAICSMRTSRGP